LQGFDAISLPLQDEQVEKLTCLLASNTQIQAATNSAQFENSKDVVQQWLDNSNALASSKQAVPSCLNNVPKINYSDEFPQIGCDAIVERNLMKKLCRIFNMFKLYHVKFMKLKRTVNELEQACPVDAELLNLQKQPTSIVIYGPLGTQKHALAQRLAGYLNKKLISMEEIVRAEIKANSDIGKQVR